MSSKELKWLVDSESIVIYIYFFLIMNKEDKKQSFILDINWINSA